MAESMVIPRKGTDTEGTRILVNGAMAAEGVVAREEEETEPEVNEAGVEDAVVGEDGAVAKVGMEEENPRTTLYPRPPSPPRAT